MRALEGYNQKHLASVLLRVGISSTFLYAAYSGFTSPSLWVGYVPDITFGLERSVFLQIWGACETVLAIWLLSGWRVYLPAAALVIATAGLILSNISQFSVLFRDVVIVFACFALIVLHCPGLFESGDR